ncbi:hypothetical protein K502DRAFT_296058 [Neoconidiobolus thromboides FSU 785]|nr:hypothetical protein K502DRAFT_296058 [Neoconidiobolus thromboides FSU 785]
MLCRVNTLRKKVGKKPVKVDLRLMQSSQKHSEDQARNRQMSHDGIKTKFFGDQIRAEGYRALAASENVAFNQRSIVYVMNSWRKSLGHYINIIEDFECLGWGEKDFYWTQNFASGSECTEATLPNCKVYSSFDSRTMRTGYSYVL